MSFLDFLKHGDKTAIDSGAIMKIQEKLEGIEAELHEIQLVVNRLEKNRYKSRSNDPVEEQEIQRVMPPT